MGRVAHRAPRFRHRGRAGDRGRPAGEEREGGEGGRRGGAARRSIWRARGSGAAAAAPATRLARRAPPTHNRHGRQPTPAPPLHPQGDPAATVDALRALLAEWPLCYGYWKKLADAAAAAATAAGLEGAAAVVDAYEAGLASPLLPATPDLWLPYAARLVADDADEEAVRRWADGGGGGAGGARCLRAPPFAAHPPPLPYSVYERAVASSGDAWSAAPLWDAYAEWAASAAGGGAPGARAALAILARAAASPTRDVDRHRARLHEVAASVPLEDLIPEGELAAARAAAAPAGAADGGPPPPDHAVAAAWLAPAEAASAAVRVLAARLAPHEARIRRSYFHVKPLDGDQLAGWWALLDEGEGGGSGPPLDPAALDRLYRRCLVATAAYPDFWRRRSRALEAAGDVAGARAAAAAAADTFCKFRPEAWLFAARADEAAGDVDAARSRLTRLRDSVAPGLAQAAVAVAHLERRAGDPAAASAALDAALAAAAGDPGACAALAVHAALLKGAAGDVAGARGALSAALAAAPGERALWETAAVVEERYGGDAGGERAVAVLQAAAAPPPAVAPAGDGAPAPAPPPPPSPDGLPLPHSALPPADRASLSAKSVALAEARAGIAVMRRAAALHDARFGYTAPRPAHAAVSAATAVTMAYTGTPAAPAGGGEPWVPRKRMAAAAGWGGQQPQAWGGGGWGYGGAPQQQQQWQPQQQ